jgi:hypothetical protein
MGRAISWQEGIDLCKLFVERAEGPYRATLNRFSENLLKYFSDDSRA